MATINPQDYSSSKRPAQRTVFLNGTNTERKNVGGPAPSKHSPILTPIEHLTSSGLFTNVILLSDKSHKSLHTNIVTTLPAICCFSFHRSPSACLLLSPLTRRGIHKGGILSLSSHYIPEAQHRASAGRYSTWICSVNGQMTASVIQDFPPSEASGAGILHPLHLAAHRRSAKITDSGVRQPLPVWDPPVLLSLSGRTTCCELSRREAACLAGHAVST